MNFILLLGALVGFVPFFVFFNRAYMLDWEYFNSLHYVLRSVLLNYHQWPLHDPWVCGGQDLMTNPQNAILSPIFWLTAWYLPQTANILSLVLLSVIGAFGARRFFLGAGATKQAATVCALLFVNSSWFGLHFAEGHIPYRTFLLIPLLFSIFQNRPNLKGLGHATLLWLVMLVDGGAYAFIHSSMTLLLVSAFRIIDIKSWLLYLRPRLKPVVLLVSGGALVVTARFWPILLNIRFKEPILDQTTIEPLRFASFLLFPLQSPTFSVDGGIWREHEFGCYFGILGFLVIYFSKQNIAVFQMIKKAILPFALIVWMAAGWGGDFNPWSIIQKIPLLNIAHVQSRWILMAYLLFLVPLALSLSSLRKATFLIVTTILISESLVAKIFPAWTVFQIAPQSTYSWALKADTNISSIQTNIPKPHVYLSNNVASLSCYEPARTPTEARHINSPLYRGMAWSEFAGDISIDKFVPGEIEYSWKVSQPTRIFFNTNFLYGWEATGASLSHTDPDKLLSVNVTENTGNGVLRYKPSYMPWILALYALGCIILGLFFLICARRTHDV